MRRHPHTVLFALAVAAIVVLAIAGCSGGGGGYGSSTPAATPPASSSSGAATNGGTTVTEQNFAFNPSTLTVKVGDTVTFTNNDSAPHNVKIDGQELGTQNQGESKTWTPSKAGSFPFSCTIHPAMTGQITVQ